MNLFYLFLVGYLCAQHLLLQNLVGLGGDALMLVNSATALLLMLVFEKVAPYRREWAQSRGDRTSDFLHTNILFPAINILVQNGILKMWAGPPVEKSGIVEAITHLVFFLLVCEFGYYWFHRAAHHLPFLWRFHRLHHSPLRLYWMNAALFHPLEMVVSTFVYLGPLYLFGAHPDTILFIGMLNIITGYLEHANIDTRSGGLNYLFNTAELHRWHHSSATFPPVNFGKVLSVWDWVFRTAKLPKTGFSGELGTEDRNPPVKIGRQWTYPFIRTQR